MRFGKYPTATYRWVIKNDIGYARWAVLELSNECASPLLARFAWWAKDRGIEPLGPHDSMASPAIAPPTSTSQASADRTMMAMWAVKALEGLAENDPEKDPRILALMAEGRD